MHFNLVVASFSPLDIGSNIAKVSWMNVSQTIVQTHALEFKSEYDFSSYSTALRGTFGATLRELFQDDSRKNVY